MGSRADGSPLHLCQLSIAVWDMPWTAPMEVGVNLLGVRAEQLSFPYEMFGHDRWVLLAHVQWKIHLCGCDQSWACYWCQAACEKTNLWDSLKYPVLERVIITIIIMTEWFFFVCLFLAGTSILNWRSISHRRCSYSKPIYFCCNPQFDELSFLFSFRWKKSLIWRPELLLSRQTGNGGRENCVTRSPRSSTSKPRINWNRSGERWSKSFWKVFCKYCIYFSLSSGQVVLLEFTKGS